MSKPLKIVTVTLNPALDLTGSLSSLKTGSVNLINAGSLHPAGKGINVAKVLSELGANVTVTGLLGENNQQEFVELFKSLSIDDRFIRVDGATRINVKIVENSDQVTDLNFPGIQVNEPELIAFEKTLFELAKDHELFVIAGSLPQGVSAVRCASWIGKLQGMGKKVFFDSSNQALVEGVKSNPYLIKPNDDELSALTAFELNNEEQLKKSAKNLLNQGCENIVISLGEKGVLWLDKSGWLSALPPKTTVVSTVGAGDTLVAGLCWGKLNEWDKAQTIRFSTALASLAVSQIGVGINDLIHLNSIQEKVTVTTLN